MGEKKIRDLWTMKELCQYLQMARSTVYLIVAQGKIPCHRVGKHMRFIPEDVEIAVRKLK